MGTKLGSELEVGGVVYDYPLTNEVFYCDDVCRRPSLIRSLREPLL